MTARHWATRSFALLGLLLPALLLAGLVADLLAFDRTRGGYEPPYEDVVGPPIDWAALDRTAVGFLRRGYVVDVLLDCRSGRIDLEAFGLAVPFRELSPRALAVHRPREACIEQGHSPAF